MKKEYLILIALILILSGYLLFHKKNKATYVLPEIVKLDTAKITDIIINKKEGQIKFTKKEKVWILTDKAYPADSSSVENMLDTLKTLKLSALVSQKEDVKRYELDEENRIQVNVMNGQETLFEVTLGKTAPTFNHTFIMLKNDKNIYHANGNFRSYFDKTVEDFKEKKIVGPKERSKD